MSWSMALRRSPKPGALTATEVKVPRILLTTSVARASPSTSSATMSSGRPVCITFSRTGTRSWTAEIFWLAKRIVGSSSTASWRSGSVTKYGERKPLSNCMPSVKSSSRPKVLDSSTVTVPSLPTRSMASARTSPMALSPAEMEATCAISFLESISFACAAMASTAALTARSMPRLSEVGLAPAATLRRPSLMSACASTVAVVVPSPATSLVLVATSLTSCAPMFSKGSSSSISRAMETPSLVIVGAPNFFSMTTLRPLGPSVTFTVLASRSTPASSPRRAASSYLRIFAMSLLALLSPRFPSCGLRVLFSGVLFSVSRGGPAPEASGRQPSPRARTTHGTTRWLRPARPTGRAEGRRSYLSTLARTSRPDRISRSSPSTVISVPPYLE